MNITAMISAVQAKLGITADGKAGPETWDQLYRRIVFNADFDVAKATQNMDRPADARSEGVIATLHPLVWPYARALVIKAGEAGIVIKIISGLRSYAEQDEIYKIGRTVRPDDDTVTGARGGYSNHNFGIAFDIGIFEGSKYIEESPKYKAVAVLGMDIGLEWGGNWKTRVDEPHYQLRPVWAAAMTEPQMLAQLRMRKDSGKDLYA